MQNQPFARERLDKKNKNKVKRWIWTAFGLFFLVKAFPFYSIGAVLLISGLFFLYKWSDRRLFEQSPLGKLLKRKSDLELQQQKITDANQANRARINALDSLIRTFNNSDSTLLQKYQDEFDLLIKKDKVYKTALTYLSFLGKILDIEMKNTPGNSLLDEVKSIFIKKEAIDLDQYDDVLRKFDFSPEWSYIRNIDLEISKVELGEWAPEVPEKKEEIANNQLDLNEMPPPAEKEILEKPASDNPWNQMFN